jgi:hypothetical protein
MYFVWDSIWFLSFFLNQHLQCLCLRFGKSRNRRKPGGVEVKIQSERRKVFGRENKKRNFNATIVEIPDTIRSGKCLAEFPFKGHFPGNLCRRLTLLRSLLFPPRLLWEGLLRRMLNGREMSLQIAKHTPRSWPRNRQCRPEAPLFSRCWQ